MPSYVVLMKWTEQGIKTVKESGKRVDAARKLIESLGGKFTLYYTMGRYDIVLVAEAPNDETVNRVLLQTGMLGNVRTETLKAMTEAEGRKLFAALP